MRRILLVMIALVSWNTCFASTYCDCVASKRWLTVRIAEHKRVAAAAGGATDRSKRQIEGLVRQQMLIDQWLAAQRAPAGACKTKFAPERLVNCSEAAANKYFEDNRFAD